MYLTATSAAWRYSGNVTGPDSMFSRPRTTGAPVAFLGVPSAEDVGAAACVDDAAVAALPSFEPESLLPQAASATEPASTATAVVTCLCKVFISLLLGTTPGSVPRV